MRLGAEPDVKATVILCDRHEARAVWEEAAPFVQASIDRGVGDLTLDDLRDSCFDGRARLITFTGRYAEMVGAAVTELQGHLDGRRFLRILAYAALDFETTRDCLSVVEADAKARGAQSVLFHGRPGWTRVCGPLGYTVRQVIMEKSL